MRYFNSKKFCYILFFLVFFLSSCSTLKQNKATEEKNVASAKINIQLGMVYLERYAVIRAKQKFLLALALAPHIPETWYAMGYFLETTGNKEQANTYYLKAIKLAPKRGDTLNNYGTFLCRGGHYQLAIHYFLEASQDPEYLEVAALYENAGLCALKIPDNHLAMQYFNKALTEDPKHSSVLIELATLNYKLGNIALAKRQLKEFLRDNPPTVQSYLLEQKMDEAAS